MDDQPRPVSVAALVESIDARAGHQTDWIVRGPWPGGTADRSDPMAAQWVRRWGPARMQRSYLDACSCVEGHCAVCN